MCLKEKDLAGVEAKPDADWKTNGSTKDGKKADDDLKRQQRRILTQFFSPVFLKAFSITFFGEIGDKSQLVIIGLAVDANHLVLFLVESSKPVKPSPIGQALCTAAAVLGGKSLASQISEQIAALAGGVLFIIFGIQSFLSTNES